MRENVDNRIISLLKVGTASHHRSLVVIIGERAHLQVANLYFLLSRTSGKKLPVLWGYHKKLAFGHTKKSRMAEIALGTETGKFDASAEEPWDDFINGAAQIEYCYYADAERVLGRTFGMVVLQDFAEVTANLLCKTIETASGGGLAVLLLNRLEHLSELCSLLNIKIPVTPSSSSSGLFRKRLFRSISACKSSIFLDDTLKVLPVNMPVVEEEFTSVNPDSLQLVYQHETRELKAFKESTQAVPIWSALANVVLSIDQGKVLLKLAAQLDNDINSLKQVSSILAGRGRGKSALLGLFLAGCLASGIRTIALTAPSVSNVKTLMEFVVQGLSHLGLGDQTHFAVTHTSLNHSTRKGRKLWFPSKVAITKEGAIRLGLKSMGSVTFSPATEVPVGADMIVIDEAAALALPIVNKLVYQSIHARHVFLASTDAGYEGTGRSLSLKLFKSLETSTELTYSPFVLNQPIRYGTNDPVESWLYKFLCLGAREQSNDLIAPELNSCQLYLLDKELLFSGAPETDRFLQAVNDLFISSHYRNEPNDLQKLADLPHHACAVLLSPNCCSEGLPIVLCAMQLAVEGNTLNSNSEGNIMPHLMKTYFLDNLYNSLTGIRVVRIATHKNLQRKGYGSHSLNLLRDWISAYKSPKLYNKDILVSNGKDTEAVSLVELYRTPTFSGKKRKGKDSSNKSSKKRSSVSTEMSKERNSSYKSKYSVTCVNLDTKFNNEVENQNFFSVSSDDIATTYSTKDCGNNSSSESDDQFDDCSLDFLETNIEHAPSNDRPKELCVELNQEHVLNINASKVSYLGAVFGLTTQLIKFWRSCGYDPVYLRYDSSEQTGECSTMVIQSLSYELKLDTQICDFYQRYIRVSGLPCCATQSLDLHMQVLKPPSSTVNLEEEIWSANQVNSETKLLSLLSHQDLKRLKEVGTGTTANYKLVLDLLPLLAELYFGRRIKFGLSYIQAAALVGISFARKSINDIASELKLEPGQVITLLAKAVDKFHKYFYRILVKTAGHKKAHHLELATAALQISPLPLNMKSTTVENTSIPILREKDSLKRSGKEVLETF